MGFDDETASMDAPLVASRNSINDSSSTSNQFFDPKSRLFRGCVLIGCCLLTFGSYFSYDIPGASQDDIESAYDISSTQYSLLYSIYSVPNTLLPFFGGFLVDRVFGLRFGGIIFCSLVTVGQLIFSFSSWLPNPVAYWVAIAGRFVFGLGGESLSVVQSTYCAKWFKGRELALSFGITLSFSRIGSALNFILVPTINKHIGVDYSLWLGSVLCVVSMVTCIVLALLDRIGEKNASDNVEVKAEEPIALRDVLSFPISIWFIYMICVCFYIGVFVFMQISLQYFVDHFWNGDNNYSTQAGYVNAIPYTLAAFLSPVFGFTVDRVGRSVTWLIVGSAMCAIAQLLMLQWVDAPWSPVIGMTIIGTAYSLLAASLWPCVALIVKGQELGTAYGLMTAIQNTGLTIAPIISGQLIDVDPSYTYSIFYFMANFILAMDFGLVLAMIDWKEDGILNASSEVRRVRLQQMEDVEQSEIRGREKSISVVVDQRGVVLRVEEENVLAPRTIQNIRNSYLTKIGIAPSYARS